MIAGIIIGILAGFIAFKFTSGSGKGCLVNLILGIIGGGVGGWVFSFLGISTTGRIGELVTATVGAVLVLWIWNKLK